jgi:hypothetical protein
VTSTETVDWTKLEESLQSAKPCQMRIPEAPCPKEAKWMAWANHTGTVGCPGVCYSCDDCRNLVLELFTKLAQYGAVASCKVCGVNEDFGKGTLDTHIRFMEL